MATVVRVLVVVALAVSAGSHPAIEKDLDRLSQALHARPDDATLYLRRAECWLEMGDSSAALADLDRAAALSSELPRVDRLRGEVRLAAGEPAAAAAALLRYVQREPGDVRGQALLGQALAAAGDDPGAVLAYQLALTESARSGGRPTPEMYLGAAAGLRALGADLAALEILDEGWRRLSAAVLMVEAIAIERALGRTDCAVERVDRLRAAVQRKEAWSLRRAELLEEASELSAAAESYRQALREIEQLPRARRNAVATQTLASEASLGLARTVAKLEGRTEDR